MVWNDLGREQSYSTRQFTLVSTCYKIQTSAANNVAEKLEKESLLAVASLVQYIKRLNNVLQLVSAKAEFARLVRYTLSLLVGSLG